jgi:hypothetical protein
MGEAKRRQKTGSGAMGRMIRGRSVKQTDFLDELADLLMMHFPDAKFISENDDLQCEKCTDFKLDLCEGQGLKGVPVILNCFSKKMGREIIIGQKN